MFKRIKDQRSGVGMGFTKGALPNMSNNQKRKDPPQMFNFAELEQMNAGNVSPRKDDVFFKEQPVMMPDLTKRAKLGPGVRGASETKREEEIA